MLCISQELMQQFTFWSRCLCIRVPCFIEGSQHRQEECCAESGEETPRSVQDQIWHISVFEEGSDQYSIGYIQVPSGLLKVGHVWLCI